MNLMYKMTKLHNASLTIIVLKTTNNIDNNVSKKPWADIYFSTNFINFSNNFNV